MGETMDATATDMRGFPFLLRFSSRTWIHFAERPVQQAPSAEKAADKDVFVPVVRDTLQKLGLGILPASLLDNS